MDNNLQIQYPVLSKYPISLDQPLSIETAAELEQKYLHIDVEIAAHRASIGKPLSVRVVTYTRENCLVLWEQYQDEMLADLYAGPTRSQRRQTEKAARARSQADILWERQEAARLHWSAAPAFDCPPHRPIGLTEKVCYGIMTGLSSGWFALAIAVVIIVVIFGGHEFPEIHEYLASHLKGLSQ